MNIIKRTAVLCLPWLLTACATIPLSAPVKETPRPSSQPQSPVKSQPAAVNDAAEAPAAVTALLKRAQQQQHDGNEQAAAASLERAIRIAPRYPESYLRLGELRYQQGMYEQARALAEKALSLGADWWLRREAKSLVERASAAQ